MTAEKFVSVGYVNFETLDYAVGFCDNKVPRDYYEVFSLKLTQPAQQPAQLKRVRAK